MKCKVLVNPFDKYRKAFLDPPLTVIAYHGTTAGTFDVFRPHYRKNEQMGFGVHFTTNRSLAERYAYNKETARRGSKPVVYTARISCKDALDANEIVEEGTEEIELAKKLAGSRLFTVKNEHGIPTAIMEQAINATSPQRAEKLLKAAGYDCVTYLATVLSSYGLHPGQARVEQQAESIAVLNPDDIEILEVG